MIICLPDSYVKVAESFRVMSGGEDKTYPLYPPKRVKILLKNLQDNDYEIIPGIGLVESTDHVRMIVMFDIDDKSYVAIGTSTVYNQELSRESELVVKAPKEVLEVVLDYAIVMNSKSEYILEKCEK